MPEAPAATPVLSTTTTSSPALARCQAVERPWTPAPITRCLTEAGREGGTGGSFAAAVLPIAQWHCHGVSVQPIAAHRSVRARDSAPGDSADHEPGEAPDRDQPAGGLGEEVERREDVRDGRRERGGRQRTGELTRAAAGERREASTAPSRRRCRR